MIQLSDLPDVIPVFPLPGAILLPRSRLPLQLFEPRYLAMLEDTLKSNTRLIGMIQPHEVPGREGDGLYRIGCAGRVSQFSETEDGRYMITLSGVSRFRVSAEIDGFTPYRRCKVDWEGFDRDQGPMETDPTLNRKALMALLERYFTAQDLDVEWQTLRDAEDELLINSLSMLLGFEPEEKQALLEAPSLSTRRETLITLIEYALRGGDSKDFLQ